MISVVEQYIHTEFLHMTYYLYSILRTLVIIDYWQTHQTLHIPFQDQENKAEERCKVENLCVSFHWWNKELS